MDLSADQLDFFERDCSRSRPFPLSPVPASDAGPGGEGSAESRAGARLSRGEPHAGSHLTALGPPSSTRVPPTVSAGMREVPGVSAGVFPRSQVSRPFPDLPAGAEGSGFAPCAPSLFNAASNISRGLTSGIAPFSAAGPVYSTAGVAGIPASTATAGFLSAPPATRADGRLPQGSGFSPFDFSPGAPMVQPTGGPLPQPSTMDELLVALRHEKQMAEQQNLRIHRLEQALAGLSLGNPLPAAVPQSATNGHPSMPHTASGRVGGSVFPGPPYGDALPLGSQAASAVPVQPPLCPGDSWAPSASRVPQFSGFALVLPQPPSGLPSGYFGVAPYPYPGIPDPDVAVARFNFPSFNPKTDS